MHKLRQFTCAFLLGCALVQTVFASVSVRVFSKDEGLHETNIAKPRFYIQNVGDESISGFYCYYYFTVEQNQVPILDDYYTPDAATRLENLNNGNYRVRFDFSGALNPGEAKPNLSGKVVGLHYSNWSAWDKANDFSSIGTETFTLNSNIPIFTSSGVLIYGNTPSDTSIPLQPPKVSMNNALGEFAVYSSENSDIRDRAEIRGGHVGSAIYTEVGCDAVLGVGVYSGKNIFLRERAVINGDAVAGDSIKKQNNVQILGTQRNHAQLDIPVLGTKSVTFGTRDTSIGNGSSFVLTQGDYRDFQVFPNSVIRIMPGKYSFRRFLIEPDVQVVLNVSDGETIEFDIGEEIRFADRTLMSFESGTEFPLSFRVYSAQTSQLFIGNDAQIFGLFTAPLSEIHVYSRTNLNGALYGNRVVVEPESKICKPPVLTWLTHSKIVMAPEFNNLTFNYTAMVPDVTATLLVTPSALSSVSITVNGKSPDTPVDLASIENAISILLNSPEACGTTEYKLNVTKTSEYMIYVNDDSPCNSGTEDGNSWSTAFKNLQQAIDTALVRGKEIWVAEGEYKPLRVANESDPRSASFMIKPRIVLKGGFDGTETTDEPKGSVYNTILSGDLAGNDDRISSWPPSIEDSLYTNDNAYHVVTIDGHKGSEIMMTSLLIKGGVANGDDENSVGAGILVKDVSPTFEWCCMMDNVADSSGAGIFDNGSIKTIKNCLFKKNVSNRG